MNDLTKLIVDSRIDDIRREAERAALRKAARARRNGLAAIDTSITIRHATPNDEAALAELAELDSAAAPVGPVLLAESGGELRAALSLRDGTIVADPFHPTAAIVGLLVAFADQHESGRRSASRRWRRQRIWKRIPREPRTPALSS